MSEDTKTWKEATTKFSLICDLFYLRNNVLGQPEQKMHMHHPGVYFTIYKPSLIKGKKETCEN